MPLFRLVFNLTFKRDFIFYISDITWEEIIDALRLFFSNCDCCVPANATPTTDIVFDAFNVSPASDISDFIFYISNIMWCEIIDALRLFFSNCGCCVPANASPVTDIVFDAFNATPASDISDISDIELYNPTPTSENETDNPTPELGPVVANEVQLPDFNVNIT